MTPAARLSAAIEVLDAWLSGTPVERALTDWGRSSRFAGSGDRHAVRDLIYDAIRCRRSFAWAGGAETGRGLVLGGLRLAGTDPATLFTGDRHAPAAVTADEAGQPIEDAPEAVRLDIPDWLLDRFRASLGADTETALAAQRSRAPLWLRVNVSRARRDEAASALAAEEVATRPHPDINTALEVTENQRKLSRTQCYAQGIVELQDASSQAVVQALGPLRDMPVLDYCAGAGGKSLHLAASGARVTAHDVDPGRMRDLAPRAARAGAMIEAAATGDLAARGPWPLVLADAPCSGSGTWRRDPEAKWRLTPDRLGELVEIQKQILAAAARRTAPGGRLAWVTCSVLDEENAAQVSGFLAGNPDFALQDSRRYLPGPLGDGFSLAILRRSADS